MTQLILPPDSPEMAARCHARDRHLPLPRPTVAAPHTNAALDRLFTEWSDASRTHHATAQRLWGEFAHFAARILAGDTQLADAVRRLLP